MTAFIAAMGLVAAGGEASAATAVDIGYQGPSYAGVENPPTSDKPQSKLWFAQDSWWADMFDAVSGDWRIFRLDRATEIWVDTGVVIDTRSDTLADVLWDGTHLYVASHVVTISTDSRPAVSQPNKPAKLYRYSWTGDADRWSGGAYTLDTGFPKTITTNSSESMTIDEDSNDTVWATWTQVSGSDSAKYTSEVYVNSAKGGSGWGTPFVLPVAGSTADPDDISSVVAFGGNKVGVLWSNQFDGHIYWATHKDGAARDAWTGSTAAHGDRLADDHLNIKAVQTDQAGRVFAVVKTGLDTLPSSDPSAPQVELLSYDGQWHETTVSTVGNCHTRPMLMLDEPNQRVHVFATAPNSGCSNSGAEGTIFEKTAPMDNPTFATGRGTKVIQDADSAHMNNATSTKQSVTAASGIVVLASNDTTHQYWHADLNAPKPTASFTSSAPEGVAPLSVQFTDTSTGAPAEWSWDFGDGTTATDQNPAHTYDKPGEYTVTLTAMNAVGTSRSVTATITVTAAPPMAVAPTASFTSSVTEGVAPLPVTFTDTSTGAPTSWAWNFGDGTTSTDQNPPAHTYTEAGDYTVTLTATNAAGTSEEASDTITVTAPPADGGGTTDPGTGGGTTDPGTGDGGTDPGTGDGGTDPVTPPSTPTERVGSWFYLNDENSGQANIELSYGDPSDKVLVADTDGRNGDSLLIRRGYEYFVRNSLTTGVAEYSFLYGNPDDVVLVGDWDGDGRDTLAVRRGNTFFIRNSLTSGVADRVITYGDPGDIVLVGDWDGDGVDTLAVRRDNTFFIRNSLTSGVADRVITYGDPGDTVLVGRWNGHTTGLAVQRDNVFYLKYELSSGVADVVFAYGNPGDTVLVGDWNGDGVDSLGVRRNG